MDAQGERRRNAEAVEEKRALNNAKEGGEQVVCDERKGMRALGKLAHGVTEFGRFSSSRALLSYSYCLAVVKDGRRRQ